MTGIGAAALMIAALTVLVAFGVQVAIALGVVSVVAVFAVAGEWQAVLRLIVTATRDGLRSEVFIAIPLFMLMGEFIARSGAVSDIFRAAARALRAVPAGPALAGVIGNALFSFAAGSSTAGAAGFTRIAHAQLRRHGYDRALSLGTLASASALGMLLPPSVLMVTWGILGGQPVGAIFLAMLIPAVLIALGFAGSVLIGGSAKTIPDEQADALPGSIWGSLIGIVLALAAVLGGIGAGVVSPAEAASIGAAIGLVMALGKGMRPGAIVEAILAVGRTCAPILLLIFAALLYAQALAVTGAGPVLIASLAGFGAAPALAVMFAIWLALATILDSLSAVALTAAVFVPATAALGFDPLAIAVIGIIVLEAAPLVPPLGFLAFAARAAAEESGVAVFDVFMSILPFLAVLLAAVALVVVFPGVATWLPHYVR